MKESKIRWLKRNKKSFLKAKNLDKPIILDISAVWCHWCHVMDETTYANIDVAKLIDQLFIPIRVDRDKRPDIDKRYNMGGWPTTAFLTPSGEILGGGTYIPPQQMIIYLDRVSKTYQKEKATIKEKLKKIQNTSEKPNLPILSDFDNLQSIIDDLVLKIVSSYDDLYGGFGNAPKFPHTDVLKFMLLHSFLHRKNAALTIVKKTLNKMSSEGLYDKVENGFFRYSTTRDWSIPHYEKMCEDNAKLLINYLETYQATGDRKFLDVAKGILNYVNTKLSDQQNGGFYGSQDADEEYYKLSRAQRNKKIGPKVDNAIFINWNAMMVSGFLLSSIVVNDPILMEFALKTVKLLIEKAFSSKTGMKHYILNGKSHVSGLLTDQIYMMKCLIDCYQYTANREFLDYAEKISGFMFSNLWDDDGGFYDKIKKQEELGNLKILKKPFEENCIAIEVFLRLYHLTGKKQYLDIAKKIITFLRSIYQNYGIIGVGYGIAVEMFLHPIQIHIIGSRKHNSTLQFLNESLRTYNPLKTVEILDPKYEKKRLNDLGYKISDSPIAYICSEGSCRVVQDPNKIINAIRGVKSAV